VIPLTGSYPTPSRRFRLIVIPKHSVKHNKRAAGEKYSGTRPVTAWILSTPSCAATLGIPLPGPGNVGLGL
jgi:hypothetical protein